MKIDDLPDNWNSISPIRTTQIIGDDYAQGMKAAILKVPGSIIPEESNYLINPSHPDIQKRKVINKTLLKCNSRLKV